MTTAHLISSVAPFRHTSEVPDEIEAVVTGHPPEWLRGELLRTCPAVFEGRQWRAQHWFDGLGLVYAFRIGASSMRFQSRLLESDASRELASGAARLSSFGTPTGRTMWQRLIQPIQRATDNANVNIVKIGDDLVALTEGDRELRVDPQSLRALGTLAHPQDGVTGTITSAHPQFDFERHRLVNLATRFGLASGVSIYEEGRDRTRRVVGTWRTRRVPYMHSFGLTSTRAILVAHPFSVAPLDMLWSNRGFIDHFEWRPRDGTRLVVIDRATGAVIERETDPLFVFHTVNAFERGNDTVLDVLAYPDARIVDDLRVERMLARLPDLRPSLVRIVMHAGKSRATLETLRNPAFEYPSINYRRSSGRDYQYAWGTAEAPGDGSYQSTITKTDVRSGSARTFSDGDHVYGEPIFVARPGATEEDDGVLLAVGSSQRADTSTLAILDAATMEPLARAEVPVAIPLGFHGSFLRNASGET